MTVNSFMNNNFPWFGYESFQPTKPTVSKKYIITDNSQKQVHTNFLEFDWDKFFNPKKKQLSKSDIQNWWSPEMYQPLSKRFDRM